MRCRNFSSVCPGGAIDLLRFWLSETDRVMMERLTALPSFRDAIRDRITVGESGRPRF